MIVARYQNTVFTTRMNADGDGFAVFRYRCVDDGDGHLKKGAVFRAVGYYLPETPDCEISLKGEWVSNRHGEQFRVLDYEISAQSQEIAVKSFLCSGLVEGIGPKTADRIYDMFGDQTFDVMSNDIRQLLKVRGISKKKLEKIRVSYQKNYTVRDLVKKLSPYDVSLRRIRQIYNVYREEAMEVCQKHPYEMSIRGILPFSVTEKIGRAVGFVSDHPERIAAGIYTALREYESTGNVYQDGGRLVSAAGKLLGEEVSKQKIQSVIRHLVKEKKVMYVRHLFGRRSIYDAESHVAEALVSFTNTAFPAIKDIDERVRNWEETNGFTLHEQQRLAVVTALNHPVSVITGGPGRGKTTIANAIVAIREECGGSVCLLSPTGCAAKRLSAATGESASTIHSCLQLRVGDGDRTLDAQETIKADTIIVDECSMLDIWVAEALLSNIESGCQVVFVGDTDQLPSVGAGAVLRDIIACGVIPVVELTAVFRQKGESLIVTNADRIRDGNPQLLYDKSSFVGLRSYSFERSADTMVRLYQSCVARYGKREVVCLTPHHHAKTQTSVDQLNKMLQQAMNPPAEDKQELTYRGQIYRVGDLVMQIKNRDTVVNGDVGEVKEVDENTVIIDFDGTTIPYTGDELEDLELGYAMSIHKSQGSEYQCVILNLQREHGTMLKRNLLYTAITRAKKVCYLVSNEDAVATAVLREEKNNRKTLLAEKIRQLYRKSFADNPFLSGED